MVILPPAGHGVLGLLAGQQTSDRLWCSPFLPNRVTYHWRELPQVSFLSPQKFCACLSRQNTFFWFVFVFATKACYSFVATNFCRDKHVFCRDKSMLAATKYITKVCLFCRDKRRVLSRQWSNGAVRAWLIRFMHVIYCETRLGLHVPGQCFSGQCEFHHLYEA